MFQWDAADAEWEQMGIPIDGEAKNDKSGRSVSLSADGTVVAIGAERNTGGGGHSGHARVFAWDAAVGLWAQRGQDLDGDAWTYSCLLYTSPSPRD